MQRARERGVVCVGCDGMVKGADRKLTPWQVLLAGVKRRAAGSAANLGSRRDGGHTHPWMANNDDCDAGRRAFNQAVQLITKPADGGRTVLLQAWR